MKEKTNRRDFIKVKNFFFEEDTVRVKRQVTPWAKMFAKYISDKGLLYEMYKEVLKPK